MIYGLTIHGHRWLISAGIFCETCGVEISTEVKEGAFLCTPCSEARTEAMKLLWELGTPKLRRASRMCNIEWQQDAALGIVQGALWHTVLLRKPMHDKNCSCGAKV